MPIYEYVCDRCQHQFEVKQKVNDSPVSGCLQCGGPVTKVISAPAIMFKGSGWYVTDYSDKLKPPAQADATGQPANDQKASKDQKGTQDEKGTQDQKPAAATETETATSTPSGGASSSTSSSSTKTGSGSTGGSGSSSTPAST
ncbi:MAG: FmdB family zinc ribbon protein [Nitrospiraceae bacterium]